MSQQPLSTPPVAPREAAVRDLHGEQVADPYAWMSHPDDPRVAAQLSAEREHYERVRAPRRGRVAALATLLRGRLADRSSSCPWWQGELRYQLEHPEGAEYPRLLRWAGQPIQEHPIGEPELLLDVTVEAAGADYAELGLIEPSDDGRWLAYSLDVTGNELYALRFRDLTTGRDLPEEIPGTYYGGAWTADGSAFYYVVTDAAHRPCEIRRHRLGTPVEDDELVYVEHDRHVELEPRRTRSGDHIVITAMSRTMRQELVLDAHDPAAGARPLRPRRPGVEDHAEYHRTATGGRWLVVTNERAREFSLLVADEAARQRGEWTELVAARPGQRLQSCAAFADALVFTWRREAQPVLELRSPDGALCRELTAPAAAGTVRLGPNHDYDAPGVVVATTSLIDPVVHTLEPFGDSGDGVVIHRAPAPGHDPSRYVTTRITVPAADGTPIPVTLAHRAGLAPGGPGLLYGYGSYESCEWPEFDPALPVWLDQGLVYALAHIRGGGEGGRTWWLQARMECKATTFTDYLEVADGLVARGIVDGARLATRGVSAGGLLQGVVLSRRPDRWAAVVAEVPFVDCLNSMLDADLPLTVGEWEEWGDPHLPEQYAWLRAYAPYEVLPDAAAQLPPVLVTGAVHDPRVMVHEPAKWVAALRDRFGEAVAQRLLFRVETGAGSHGGPAGRYALMDYEAEVMAFVLDAVDVPEDPASPA